MKKLVSFFFFISAAKAATVSIDGSSTVYPISEAAGEEFQTMTRGAVKVTIGIKGTGGGFKRFCRGETDIQNASRPIMTEEIQACKKSGINYVELPIAYDAIVIVVNPSNSWLSEINVEELKKIWEPSAQAKVKKWNQINPKWPDQEFKLFGAGADSGTFDYFTEAIVGKAKSSRGDYTASEDDNTLVQGISQEKNALGFLPISYYEQNKTKLKALGIVTKDKKGNYKSAVLPTRETVEKQKYFPLSRPIFIYVNEVSSKKDEVKKFVEFFFVHATKLVESVHYIPLPIKAYDLAKNKFSQNKTGSVFGGHSEIGLSVEDLLKKEAK